MTRVLSIIALVLGFFALFVMTFTEMRMGIQGAVAASALALAFVVTGIVGFFGEARK